MQSPPKPGSDVCLRCENAYVVHLAERSFDGPRNPQKAKPPAQVWPAGRRASTARRSTVLVRGALERMVFRSLVTLLGKLGR